jgi:hypothetical protein
MQKKLIVLEDDESNITKAKCMFYAIVL